MVQKSIEEAQAAFEQGVAGKGAKWEENTAAAGGDYGTGFRPILSAQNRCGAQARSKAAGYDALLAYAQCMKGSGLKGRSKT